MPPRNPATGLDRLPRLGPEERLIDSHCHLDMDVFEQDRAEVIARAASAGVSSLITIGAGGSMASNHAAVRVAQEHERIFATVGIHPHDASEVTDSEIEEIGRLAKLPKVVAIGETGLDYHYEHSPRTVQREVFRRFIDLARRHELPLVVHLREADEDAVRILREERAGEVGGVIHCFSSNAAAARQFLDLGFHLSFSGIVTFDRSDDVREAARIVPEDRFLVETDAPYLAPAPFRGRRNEPALVVQTAQALAEIRGTSLETLALQTERNTRRLFRLDRSA